MTILISFHLVKHIQLLENYIMILIYGNNYIRKILVQWSGGGFPNIPIKSSNIKEDYLLTRYHIHSYAKKFIKENSMLHQNMEIQKVNLKESLNLLKITLKEYLPEWQQFVNIPKTTL